MSEPVQGFQHFIPLSSSRGSLLRMLLALLMLVLHAGQTFAQGDANAPSSGTSNEVVIQPVVQGIGGRVRPGEWTAFAFSITDRSSKSRNILIRLSTTDIDGDDTQWSRATPTTPGKATILWTYARVPFTTDSGTVFTASAYEANEKDAADALGKATIVAGRRLGSTQFRIGSLVSSSSGLMLVIGGNRAGLDRYAERNSNQPWAPTGHELTEVLHGVRPIELPDRSIGLRGFETIVWTGSTPDEQPDRLSVPQVEALRTWVYEGGHLIILIPTVGQHWVRAPGVPIQSDPNPLADVMPRVALTRRDGQNLEQYRWLLTWPKPPRDVDGQLVAPESLIPLPSSVVVHTFAAAPDAGPYDAMPILAGPVSGGDGSRRETVVVRRLVGCGAVTLIGLDLTHPGLVGDALRADAFWNRVLGKRLELASLKDLKDRKISFAASREPSVCFDDAIDASIQRNGRSAGGLLLALVVFGAFWLLAGPVSFFVLKKRRLSQHAWLAFVAVIIAFTVISWTGASMLRQRSPDARFVAFLDHVYGQSNQRARVWANLFLPAYGEQRVSISQTVDPSGRWHPSLSPWEPPGVTGNWAAFPDVRGYDVDARTPESIAFPSRSTEKRVQIDWAGPPQWSMPFPQSSDSSTPTLGSEILLSHLDTPVNGRDWTIVGTLRHNLPGTLENVQVLIITGLSPVGPEPKKASAIPADASMFSIGDWEAGKDLSLAKVTLPSASDKKMSLATYMFDARPPKASGPMSIGQKINFEGSATKYFTDLALFSMIAPPEYESTSYDSNQSLARREASHTYDLSRWFTQPCVIIIGHLKDSESPVPITVDGEPIATKGHTVVRWVYPLRATPPMYEVQKGSTSGSGGGSGK